MYISIIWRFGTSIFIGIRNEAPCSLLISSIEQFSSKHCFFPQSEHCKLINMNNLTAFQAHFHPDLVEELHSSKSLTHQGPFGHHLYNEIMQV